MLVCICKGLSERQILGTIHAGARTVEEIGKRCGAGTDCGTCTGALEAMCEEDALVRASRLVRHAASSLEGGRPAHSRHAAANGAIEGRQRDPVEAKCASPERDAA